MVQQHVADREAARAQSADASCEGGDAQPRLAYGLVAGPPVASGQRAVPRVHPYSGVGAAGRLVYGYGTHMALQLCRC